MPDSPDTSSETYEAFGLTIESELPLDGFAGSAAPKGPDVLVRLGVPAPDDVSADCVSAIAHGVLRASVRQGREIIVEVVPGADPLYVSAVVTGELFSVLLRQRGMLVLHGSGVSRDDYAIGFMGESGWGKSTLATALVSRGWDLLTDDLLVLDGLAGGAAGTPVAPMAVPTHPSMRLSSTVVDHAAIAGRTAGQAHSLTSKLRVDRDDAFADRPARLAHLFVLEPDSAHAHSAVEMSARDAVEQFVLHTRGRRLLVSAPALRAHLGQCVQLARAVPTARLHRRFGFDRLDALCDLVESVAAASS